MKQCRLYCFGVLFLAASAPAQVTLFEDNFDSGMSPEWWMPKPLQWVQDGTLHTQADGSAGRDSAALVHTGDAGWTDYVFTGRIDPILVGTDWEEGEIYFRVATASPTYYSFNPFVGYRMLVVEQLGSDVNKVVVTRDGASWDSGVVPVFYDGWNDFRVEAVGHHITVDLNGYTVLDFLDYGGSLYGGVGVGAIWEAHSRFDDLKVETPEPASALVLLAALPFLRRRRA